VGSRMAVKICIRSNIYLLARLACWSGLIVLVACGGNAGQGQAGETVLSSTGFATGLHSLQEFSVEALRAREYRSKPEWVAKLAESAVVAYESDGLRVYSRMDVPAQPPPAAGYPVLVFVHGWVGRQAAPEYDFAPAAESQTAQLIKTYVDAGFVVLTPGLRGHGTVNGIAAEGIEFLDAWDNASYLSPIFYAIDVLNLVAGIPHLETMPRPASSGIADIRIDLENIHIQGHSQGADAALTALAVSGEGSSLSPALKSGSIWSGCFGPRLEQASIYGPMASSLQAFMSGDGSWTGTATGSDGSVNPDFVFGYPPDWIATVDPKSPDWTWQANSWPLPTVAMALQQKFTEMYSVINAGVADIDDAEFSLSQEAGGKTVVQHDPRIVAAMSQIGGYDKPQFLTEPIHFHYSDQDYYSPPRWNEDLAARINQNGGSARTYVYPQNNHSLRVSPYPWFSRGEVREGFPMMLRRDLALFLNSIEERIARQGLTPLQAARLDAENPLSVRALSEFAAELRNEFEFVSELEPLDGMRRVELGFTTDGLQQYALMIQPAGEIPQGGWPVLLMNHGYHPQPAEYGRIADGTTDRPGDYYRSVPPMFAREGFMVVVPDYRGHNDSEGGEFTAGVLAPYWYARDVVSAFRSLSSLPGANPRQAFMWGHSMGGPITLRALLALGDEVRAASIWSTGPAWLQSPNPGEVPDWQQGLQMELERLPFPLELDLADSGPILAELTVPLHVHHAMKDGTTSFGNSTSITKALDAAGRPSTLFTYEGSDHLFKGENLNQAVERDVFFFLSYIKQTTSDPDPEL